MLHCHVIRCYHKATYSCLLFLLKNWQLRNSGEKYNLKIADRRVSIIISIPTMEEEKEQEGRKTALSILRSFH